MRFGDPGRTARFAEIAKKNNARKRDTSGTSGPLTVNSLDKQTGHAKPRKTSTLSKFMKLDHKRMSRVIGYTLTLSDADAWAGFTTVAMACLTVEERAALAWAALRSLDTPEQAEQVASTALTFADYPLPTFLNPMEDARWWASCASLQERKAYALAAYEALPMREQMAFRNHISEVEIAA